MSIEVNEPYTSIYGNPEKYHVYHVLKALEDELTTS